MDYLKMKKAQLIEEIEVLQEKVAELGRVQTERKRAEEVLQESEERYRSFVQNLDGIAYRGNVNFEPEFFHGAVEKMTGYTEQDFMEGKIRWDSIIHKDDLPGYLEKVKERIEDKPLVAESEFRIVHRNGSIRWIHEIFQTVFDDSGQVIGSQGIQHDITERKQAEEALQESEEHFRSLVTSASDVITMTDLEGNILFINEAGKTLHGVDDLNALIGRNAFSLIAEESLESAREGMEIVLRKGVAKNREYVLVRDDGKKVPVEMTVSVIRDVGGKPFRFMAITRDIAKRKRVEEALRESEASLARAQQIAHLGNWDWDVEGATLTWSDEVYRIFGIEREFELTYEGIEAMVHPDDRERNQEFVNELLATADSADIEFRIIRPDGAVRRIYQNAEVRRDEAGNANRVFGIMQDITERKRAEEALWESEERYRQLVELSPETIAVHSEGKIVFINTAGAKLLGAANPDQLIGKPIMDFLHPDYRDTVKGRIGQIGEEGEEAPVVEEKFIRLDGTVVDVEVAAIPFTYQGRPAVQAIARDITERKRAEEALRESEEKYRLLVENATVAIVVAQDGMLKFFNPEAMELTGYSQEELTSQPFTELIHPDDLEVTVGYHLRFLQGEETPLFHAFRIIDKEGNIKWLESNAVLITWEGRPATLNFISDITERVRAEEALRESEERFRSLFEGAEDHIFVVDRDFRYVMVNPGALKAGGFTLEDVVGQGPREAFPEDAEFYLSQYRQAFETGKPVWFERGLRLPDGDHWFSVTLSPIRDAQGRVMALTGISRDITERKRAEKALRRREQEIRAIAENVPALVSYVDADGCYRFVNRRYEEWFGVPRTEIVGKHYRQVLGDETYEQIRDRVEAALSGQRVSYEEALAYARGGTRWVMADYVPDADDGGKVNGFFALVTDITERKQAEEALRESEERLSNFMDSATDGFILFDSEMDVVEINRAALKVFGVGRDVIGKNAVDVSPDVVESGRYDKYMEVIRTGKPFFTDDVVPHCKFGDIHLAIRAFKVGDGLGTIVTDITERKRAEEALRESEEQYRHIFEQSPVGIGIASLDGKIVAASKAMEAITGYSLEELKKIDLVRTYENPEDRETLLEAISRHGSVVDFPVRLKRKDGTPYDALLSVSRINLGGKDFLQTICQDITQRKRAEEAVRRSLEETARGQRTLLALSQAAQAVQRARTPEEVYQTIGDEVAGLGYNAVILTLTDDRKHLLVSHHTFRTAPERAAERIMGLSVRDLRLPVVPGGVVHRLIFYGEAIFSEEKASEFVAEALPGFLRPLASRLTALLKLERRIMAPLTVGDEEFGLLIVTGAGLTEADVPAITAFANQAAIAIENARLFEQVQAGRDRLKLLTRQVVSAQEEERQRLARELHDELGQALTGIGFDLSAIKRELPSELDPEITKRLASASSLLSQTDEWVSELALDLRPYMLDDLGLVSALRWYTNRYAKRLDIEVEMEAIDFEGRLTPEVETALYRVVQEALTNVAKHAQANQVKIRLERKKAAVAAIVEDDGQGFDVETMAGPSAPERGAGLLGMRERASFLGGILSIESTPGKGTRLAIEIPV